MNKNICILVSLVFLASCASSNRIALNGATAHNNPICLLSGLPPAENTYKVVKKLKYAKNGYGGINTVLPIIIRQAQSLGADAIIDYNGGHRFGFWPWQFVRPVVRGTAVNWNKPGEVDCEAIGGTFDTQLKGSLTTDK